MEITKVISNNIFNDFTDIKNRYRLGDEEFKKGLSFCTRLSTGESRIDIWKDIFGDEGNPRRDSTRFMKMKWVDDILHRLYTTNHFEHVDKRNKILEKMYQTAMDDRTGSREQINAAKVYLENTALPDKLNEDVQIDISDEAKEAMLAFTNTMRMISEGKAPMLDNKGKFLDVEVIE